MTYLLICEVKNKSPFIIMCNNTFYYEAMFITRSYIKKNTIPDNLNSAQYIRISWASKHSRKPKTIKKIASFLDHAVFREGFQRKITFFLRGKVPKESLKSLKRARLACFLNSRFKTLLPQITVRKDLKIQ